MTELERRERHEAEIAAWYELDGDPYDLDAHLRPVRAPLPANDDAPTAANDNADMDEAA